MRWLVQHHAMHCFFTGQQGLLLPHPAGDLRALAMQCYCCTNQRTAPGALLAVYTAWPDCTGCPWHVPRWMVAFGIYVHDTKCNVSTGVHTMLSAA